MAIASVGSASNAAASGTAVSVTHGLTISSGDVVITTINFNGSSAVSDNNGATSFDLDYDGQPASLSERILVFSRVAGASEPSAYNFTAAGSNRWSIIVRVYSGVDAAVYDVAPIGANLSDDTSGTPSTATGITTLTATALAIAWHTIDTGTSQTFGAATNSFIDKVAEGDHQPQASFTKLMAVPGGTGATSTTTSTTGYAALQFALKAAAAASGPSITSITDPVVTGDGYVIGGTGFGAVQGSGGVTQEQGAVVVALTETAWADTAITATSATVEATGLKYGVQTIRVTDGAAADDTTTSTQNPGAGNSFVDLTSVATVGQIITVAALAIGDQLRYENVTTPGSYAVVVLADGSFTIDGSAPDGVYAFEVKAHDASDNTWGTAADQTVTVGAVEAPAQFTFTDLTGSALSTAFTDTQALTGGTLVDASTVLAVTNGLTSVTGSGGTFDSSNKTYSAGNSFVRASVTSSASYSTAVTQTPSVNGVSDTFSVTTLAAVAPTMPADTTSNVAEPSQSFGTYSASNTPEPAAVYTVTGTDSAVLGINSSTGAVTANSPTDEGVKSTYTYTVTATNSAGAASQNIVTTIVEPSEGSGNSRIFIGIGIGI